jgi:predicted MFS family arabinose efflux permease
VAAFLFLWNFNPFSNDVQYVHFTRQLHFSEQFYGGTVAMLSAGAIAGSIAYGFYCRRVPFAWLVHASIVLGILATVAYAGVYDQTTALLATLAVGFTYMTASLIQLDLAARICPPEVSGTAFALLMALSNLSMAGSTWLGGQLYDAWNARWGPLATFNLLVVSGAGFTACCWLLVPLLRRASHAVDV